MDQVAFIKFVYNFGNIPVIGITWKRQFNCYLKFTFNFLFQCFTQLFYKDKMITDYENMIKYFTVEFCECHTKMLFTNVDVQTGMGICVMCLRYV